MLYISSIDKVNKLFGVTDTVSNIENVYSLSDIKLLISNDTLIEGVFNGGRTISDIVVIESFMTICNQLRSNNLNCIECAFSSLPCHNRVLISFSIVNGLTSTYELCIERVDKDAYNIRFMGQHRESNGLTLECLMSSVNPYFTRGSIDNIVFLK